MLQARAAAGGSDNLEAGSNDDLSTWFEIQKQELSDRPDFSAIFDRYFDRDTVRPTTFYRGELAGGAEMSDETNPISRRVGGDGVGWPEC